MNNSVIGQLSKTIQIVCVGTTIVLAIALLFGQLASAASSKSSQLTQHISPSNCGGLPECDLQPPTITSAHNQSKHLRIFGKYDHRNSQSLAVFFNGVWYALGVDSELTVSGDSWILNLDAGDGLPLAPGSYPIEVRMVTTEGNVMTYTASLNVSTPSDNDQDPDKPDKKPNRPSDITIFPPSTGFLHVSRSHAVEKPRSFFDSMMVAATICVCGLVLLALAWRLNKR